MIDRPRAAAFAMLVTLLLAVSSCSDDDGDSSSSVGAEPPSGAADWVHLGLDLGNSRAAVEETEVGADDVAELAPSWERDDIKGLTGTPLVADGVVYVGDWTGHVRALDAESGEERWATDVDSFYIGGSVALDDSRVFVGTFDARVVALDRETGEELWTMPVGDHEQAAIFGSPLSVDGRVIVGVASFELMTSNPAPTFRGHVVALDADTGEEVWRYWTVGEEEVDVAGVSVWATVAVDTERGEVYVPTGNGYGPQPSTRSDAIVALDLATGEELWVTQFTVGDVWTVANPVGTDADVGSPPNLFRVGDVDAVGAVDKAGVYHALARDTGEVLWETKLTEGGLQGGALASAAVAEDVAYVASNRASQDADLVALDVATGDERWRIDVKGHVSGPVTWANGVVYLANDTGAVVGYDAADGAVLWSHPVPAQAAGGISVVDGTVYAGWGWWFSSPPEDAQGGLIAFRLGGEAGSPTPSDGEGESAASGEEIYQERCASCHGGDGGGGSGPALERVADRLSLEDHLEIVEEGRGAMPGWNGTLTEEEIQAVVDYQRSVLSDGSDG
ncbi:MAG TPA: PQQ-binding-like beta-propeller repeat protein [Acidimicrobiales bacterium]|nr:PQQ-binding-like beta-propeller repeat protein [Acidimicrobiales bacterium]